MAGKLTEGGCGCGAIRYRIAGEVTGSMICHCRTCRRVSGAAVLPWVSLPRSAYEVLKGRPAQFASSPPVRRTFCDKCGTQLTYWHESEPDNLDVTTGSLDDPQAHPPSHHSWMSDALPWLKFGDGLPTFPRSRYSEGE